MFCNSNNTIEVRLNRSMDCASSGITAMELRRRRAVTLGRCANRWHTSVNQDVNSGSVNRGLRMISLTEDEKVQRGWPSISENAVALRGSRDTRQKM